MRVLRVLGSAVAALVLLFGGAFTYVSQAPYELPAERYVQPGSAFAAKVPRRAADRTVVLLVFDGFAPAIVEAARTPNLERIAREGAHSRDMMPVFPSLSMPNHFSLSTGCYPERHGVVGNHFRDPVRGVVTAAGDADWLLACEPLHVAAERQGVRSAVLTWVANSSGTRGKLATLAEPYRAENPGAEQQVDRVLELLADDQRPDYIAVYSAEPDRSGHIHGPLARETLAMAESLDAQIGRVMTAIEERGLRDRVTLVVTTDHGMVDVKGMLNVDRIVRRAGVDGVVLAEGSIAFLHLADPEAKAQARAALAGGRHYDVIDPAAPPAYARLGRSERVGDLVIAAHEGYWMADLALWPWYLRWSSYVSGDVIPSRRFKGMHGYDAVQVPGVRAIFYAWGGGVRAGVTLAQMRSVDVHPTLAHLLGIAPGSPVDGVARAEITAEEAAAQANTASAPAAP
jgi:predicted AlkP superfamily pyrophosphatase or phosphodiesterase